MVGLRGFGRRLPRDVHAIIVQELAADRCLFLYPWVFPSPVAQEAGGAYDGATIDDVH